MYLNTQMHFLQLKSFMAAVEKFSSISLEWSKASFLFGWHWNFFPYLLYHDLSKKLQIFWYQYSNVTLH